MATHEIKTKKGIYRFRCPDAGGYVYVQVGDVVRWRQPCHGGGYMGSTLTANASTLPAVCRRWNRQRRAKEVNA